MFVVKVNLWSCTSAGDKFLDKWLPWFSWDIKPQNILYKEEVNVMHTKYRDASSRLYVIMIRF